MDVIRWSDHAHRTVHSPVHAHACSKKGYSFEGITLALRATAMIEVGLEASSSFVTKGELYRETRHFTCGILDCPWMKL